MQAKANSFNKREIGLLLALLFCAFVVRLLLFPLQGLQGDINTYQSWFSLAASNGVRPFYSLVGFCDYPPFNVYIFWVGGSLANVVSSLGVGIVYIVKLIPTVFDVATSVLIFFFIRQQLPLKQSLAATALYAFNPAVILNVAVWGQFDAVYTFFLILSLILALKSKPKSAAAAFAVGLLTKPQGIALAPLLVYVIYRNGGFRNLALSAGVFFATVFAVILPFEWSNPVSFLSNAYFGAYNRYEVTSVNAFNFWGLFGLWAPDGSFFLVGWALFGVCAGLTLFVLHMRWRVDGDWLAVFCAFMLFFTFFMLPTRIHERYLFPALSVLALMFFSVKVSRPLYAALTGTLFVNEAYILITSNIAGNAGLSNPNLTGDPLVLTVCTFNLVMFLFTIGLLIAELKNRKLIGFRASG